MAAAIHCKNEVVLEKTEGNGDVQSAKAKLVRPTCTKRPPSKTISGLPESPEQTFSVPVGPENVHNMSAWTLMSNA